MPGGPLEVGYGVSYLSIAIPVRSRRQQQQVCSSNNVRGGGGFIISERMLDEVLAAAAVVAFPQPSCHERAGAAAATGYE